MDAIRMDCRHYMWIMAIVDIQTVQDKREDPSEQPGTIKRSDVYPPLTLIAPRTFGTVAVSPVP